MMATDAKKKHSQLLEILSPSHRPCFMFFHHWIFVVHVHTQLGISTQSIMMPIISIGITKKRDALVLLLLHQQQSSAWLGQRVQWSQTNDHTFVGLAFK